MELQELQRRLEEDHRIDLECERLDAQAREAQRLQNEAHKAREALIKQLSQRRQLQRLAQELEVAKMVTTLIREHPSSPVIQPADYALPTSQLADSASAPLQIATDQPEQSASNMQPMLHTVSPTNSFSVQAPPPIQAATSGPGPPEKVPPPTALISSQPSPSTPQQVAVPAPQRVPSQIAPPPAVAATSRFQPAPVQTSTLPAAMSSVSVPLSRAPTAHPQTTTVPIMSAAYGTTAPTVRAPPPPMYGTTPNTVAFPETRPVFSNFTASPTQPYVPPVPALQHSPFINISFPNSASARTTPEQTVPNAVSLYHQPPPGMELLIASSYGIPKPSLPCFESGKESDFALLKMGLDNLLNPHHHLSEQYKYQVLLGQLKLPSALQLAKAFMHDPRPYSTALQALQVKYGQPRQLVQSELSAILNSPPIKFGDAEAFDTFALSVHSLVGMLRTLEGQHGYELLCGSHVDRLLSKMPPTYRDGFVEYCINRGILQGGSDRTYSLPDLSTWLQMKSQAKRIASRAAALYQNDIQHPTRKEPRAPANQKERATSLVYNTSESTSTLTQQSKSRNKLNPFCPYCTSKEHFLNSCTEFKNLSKDQILMWIKDGQRCWKCGRTHSPDACTLKKPCKTCEEQHLTILHDVVQQCQEILMINVPVTKIYLDRPNRSPKVMLKVVKVRLYNGDRVLDTYAVLDDGSERSIILPQAVKHLQLNRDPETLALRTVRQDVVQLQGAAVTFQVSSLQQPNKRYCIHKAFTSDNLALADHTYPVTTLQAQYDHLRHLPIPNINRAQPLLLIGSDMPHLIVPLKPVRSGPPGSPVAVLTHFGWTLQGPTNIAEVFSSEQQCLHISSIAEKTELLQHVERLWQTDTLPYVNEKTATRSKQDHHAMALLETATCRTNIEGVQRYATPLLRRPGAPPLHASKEAVLPSLRSTERRLAKDAQRAERYCHEINKLKEAGYVARVNPDEAEQSTESWFLPHHMVSHNNKDRIVFNCSFSYAGQSLNDLLLPGPTLGPSLLGVLLRFRQHTVAISGDVKGMFHQIRLMPPDRSVLRFLWRDMQRNEEPTIYEWQVLPFGTTCSPCCAIYALQRHARDNGQANPLLIDSVERSFYVDNCLQSTHTAEEARSLIDGLRELLSNGGFDLRQWTSNVPEVIKHLPPEACSTSRELLLSQLSPDLHEPTLGLRWNCLQDCLGYRPHKAETYEPTLRNVYRTLACLFDPLGYLIPFTTRAKVLIQDLWKEHMGWDDKIHPPELLERWRLWEQELPEVEKVTFPRCYVPASVTYHQATFDLHVFCDASERAYGSVAYLRILDSNMDVHVSFVLARSRVAPKKRLSMPRLELSAALTGAQLVNTLQSELTLPIRDIVLWSDSTTVLHWIKSESCRYKVFVGTRVAEVQNLTSEQSWRYVDTANNPADDITRGTSVRELTHSHRWHRGPEFLYCPEDEWPSLPCIQPEPNDSELKRSAFCGQVTIDSPELPIIGDFTSWKDLVTETARILHGAAQQPSSDSARADDFREAENQLLRRAQQESFSGELKALKSNCPLPSDSRLASLAPEYDDVTGLLRVGGRLRRASQLDLDAIHPVVLDPHHALTKLLIKQFDVSLLHPGPERVLAELRRRYWILRGREAIRKHQHHCFECQRWRATPSTPQMSDLPLARLRLFKPPFYSTGVDGFGPFNVKIGRRGEKRWGIVFKCLTTCCVHIDLLENLDTDAFLMSLRRFIARRGKPFEILCDNGTNFVGGCHELKQAFAAMTSQLKEILAAQQITFHFNPPSAPHFGGAWEREVKSIKTALNVILRGQTLPETVLHTVLIEIESILNAKPLGYLSSDIADPEPITPNLLLMGRRDSSLPQAVYDSTDLLRQRRWRHSQILADQFWTNFTRHYLPNLQERKKWRTDGTPIQVDQVVLIIDPQIPRALWPVGKVMQVYPGDDGRVRTASVLVKGRTYTRPVVRLVPLPQLSEEEPGSDVT